MALAFGDEISTYYYNHSLEIFILTFIDMCFPIMKSYKTIKKKNMKGTGRKKAKLEYFIP